MNDKQRRRHERFMRVRSFCESLPAPLPVESRGGPALTAIGSAIERCEELDAAQSTHKLETEQGTLRRKELREYLRTQVSAMNKTARAIGSEHPAVKDRFRLTYSRGNDQALLSTARAFLAEGEPYKTLFLEYGMAPNFLETLSATIAKFEQAVNQQNTGAGGRTQSRAEIDRIQEQAVGELEKLDTVVRNIYRDDEAMLAAWESASHLERAPRGAPTNEDPEESTRPVKP